MAITNPEQPFVWGQGGQALTPEQVERQREVAALLTQGGADYSPVEHWLQGAARMAQGGLGGLLAYRAGENENKGREGFQTRWDSVFGGGQTAAVDPVAAALAGTPQTASDATAALASVPSGDTAGYIRSGLLQRGLPEHVADAFLMNMQDESGLNPGINEASPTVPGSRGGFGLYQLTGPRRVAYEQYAQQLGVDPSNVDAQLDFMMSELQGPEARAAQAIMSAPDTGSAAAAIVNKFLRPAEEHRASRVARYTGGAAVPTGGGSQSPLQMAQAPDMAALLGLASDPWANDAQRSIVESLMGQQMQQQDPRYQLDLEYKQAQIAKMQAEAANGGLGNESFFGNIVPMQDENGNVVLGQASNQGRWQPLAGAEGFTPAPTTKTIDTGTEIITQDIYGNEMFRTPKQNREAAYETGFGGVEGKSDAENAALAESVQRKMPGVRSVIDTLTKLADTATYTQSGQVMDSVKRELGLDVGQGAIDRASYIAIVDNQVLPLLKDTFGAAFTVQEGESLRATLGDPNKSPAEKKAILDAFIAQKERDVAGMTSDMLGAAPLPASQPDEAPADIDALLEKYR